MRGHITKRGNTYSIVVDLGNDPVTGKRKQKWFSGYTNKKEAEKALTRLVMQIDSNQYVEEKEVKLHDYLTDWLDFIKHNVEGSTFIFYKDIVERILLPNFGKVSLNNLKPLQIQSFLSRHLENKKSSTTVRHYYNVLNISLNQAVKWQMIKSNPCSYVDPPKASKAKIALLSIEQIKKLLSYTKESEFSVMYIPILLAVTCGMRRGEILGLQWEDIDFNHNVLRVKNNLIKVGNENKMSSPKTDLSTRVIALLPSTTVILKEYKFEQQLNKVIYSNKDKNSSFVCSWADGRYLRPDYVTRTFKKLLKRCDLPNIRFHDLRYPYINKIRTFHQKPHNQRKFRAKGSDNIYRFIARTPQNIDKLPSSLRHFLGMDLSLSSSSVAKAFASCSVVMSK